MQKVIKHNAVIQHPTSDASDGAVTADVTSVTVRTGTVPAEITVGSRRRTGTFNSDKIADNATMPLTATDYPYLCYSNSSVQTRAPVSAW